MPWREQQLLRKAIEGDHEAFDALFDPLRPRLRSYLGYALGNLEDAREAENETMLRCAATLKNLEGETSADAWLFAICRNVVRERIRHRQKDRRLDEKLREHAGAEPFELGPDELLLSRNSFRRRQVVDCLEAIPARQRRVVMLRLFSGYSFTEAGERMEISADAAKMLYFRAVRSLRKVLKERGVFDE